MIPDEPTGWALRLNRASGSSTLTWGPFETMEEADSWALKNGIRGVVYVPMYLDVDWMRGSLVYIAEHLGQIRCLRVEVMIPDWQEGYLAVRQISENRYLAVMPLIYGARLVVCDETGHFNEWGFSNPSDAVSILETWDGQGEPEGWHRHPKSGRRRPDGDANQEYVMLGAFLVPIEASLIDGAQVCLRVYPWSVARTLS